MRSASAAEQQVGSWSRIRRDRWLLVSRRQEEATVSINIQETDHRYLAATGGASALYSPLGSLGNLASAPPRPLLPNCGRRTQIKVISFHTGVTSGFGSRARHGRGKRVAIRFVLASHHLLLVVFSLGETNPRWNFLVSRFITEETKQDYSLFGIMAARIRNA